MESIVFNTLDKIEAAGKEFLAAQKGKKHFAFYGDMGAGKTTFIKTVCRLLQVTDVVTSPTFSIINEYQTLGNDKVFHFDFYRIKDLEEVFNLGYEDYFYSNHYCFVEWPELVEELLPDHMVKVRIMVKADGSRVLNFD
ncbi:MAG: tRNA (adenosine(37)-N6)-threonylcarbamoyltransferase complex ATPase subunit type 1 TsaE [Bacteroidetes bacterium HGW-Bacteroidetes-4]|jgi:tRNA threonylcarbamoyladenosine biosynthesis protein TsaE|nr:MAG: tRNA (adenosine(37)-N6)-threonylcarbamoyltransferase complex ATPase subunit type 1 TsaE [Bacteroidetes bacterium HGW-Bacteroidetes-4]